MSLRLSISAWSFLNFNESLINWLLLTCAGNVVVKLMVWVARSVRKQQPGQTVVLGVVSAEA
jgi:hypothetical protein